MHRLKLYSLIPLLVFLAGLINIISSLWAQAPARIILLEGFIPLGISNFSRTITVALGIILIFLSFGLKERKRRAWTLSLIALIPVLATNLIKGLDIEEAAVNLLIVGLLLRYRHHFSVRSRPIDGRFILRSIVLAVIALVAYVYLGFFSLRSEFHTPLTFQSVSSEYLYLATGYGHEVLRPTTRRAHWFYQSVVAIHTLALVLIFPTLFAPFVAHGIISEEDRDRAVSLIERTGTNAVSPLAGMNDKTYFFNPDHTCLVAYRVSGRFAVCLGEPIGYEEEKPSTIVAFEDYCFARGLKPVWYSVDSSSLHLFSAHHSLSLGEEAVIKLDTFELKNPQLKNVRNSANKIKKEGVKFSWYECSEVPWKELQQVNLLHESWVSQKKIPPMSFSLEYFPFPVDQTGYILTGKAGDNVVCALSFFPFKRGNAYSLDLMLRGKNASNGIMETAIVEAVNHFRTLGSKELNLGLAPFTTSEKTEILEILSRWYRFRPLREFKDKFSPVWQPKYLVYKTQTDLPAIGLSLMRVHLQKGKS